MRRRSCFCVAVQRMSFICGLTFAFAVNFPQSAWSADEVAAKPVIAIDEPVFSFGSISQGTIVTHDFIIKNTGAADLTIQRLIAGCGCTAAMPPAGPVPAGQTGIIKVTFDSSGFEGNREKTVRVFSNDVDTPIPVLTLKGYIESSVDLDPVRINFGEVTKGQEVLKRDVTAKVRSGSDVTMKSISTFSKDLIIETKSLEQKKIIASVSVSPDVAVGEIRDRLLITVVNPSNKEQVFNIPIMASVKGSLELQPRTLSAGVLDGSEIITRGTKLINNSKTPVLIKSITSDSPAVTADYKAIKDGQGFVINVHVDPSKVNTDLRASVKIQTDSKEQETVTLNVYGILPPKR